MPESPWIMRQTWHNLLFAHWPIDAAVLRSKVPSAFELDLYDGRTWIGIVPFYMTNVTPRFVPAALWFSSFAELNVRTYVSGNGKPGVYFFSLDAASALAVRTARALYNLPYHRASMQIAARDGSIEYSSRRTPPNGVTAELLVSYQPAGESRVPEPGTLEYFLTERYCLFALDHRSRPYRLDIHHAPWALQGAKADIRVNTMADAAGVSLPEMAPLLHFAARQDMVGWPPQRLR
jgi:uncharacterized protein YqjF (DUF2071 family)